MTDRINLAELRARELAWSRKLLTREEFDALLDAVGAAQQFIVADEHSTHPYREYGAVEAALSAFDFGEAA